MDWEKLKGFIKLARVRHTAQVVGIVTIFSIRSHGFSTLSTLVILSYLFLFLSFFLLDDAYDYKSDQIVHPERAIPKGLFTSRQVYFIGATALLVSILFASRLLFYQFALFLVATVLGIALIFFNFNSLIRAILTAFQIWIVFPISAFPDLKILIFGLIVGLPHIGGSISKDFIHSSGDERIGLSAPPIWSKYIAALTFFLSAAVIWLPVLLDLVTWLYIPPIFITFVCCILLGVMALKGHYPKVYFYGGIGMISSLLAFLLESA